MKDDFKPRWNAYSRQLADSLTLIPEGLQMCATDSEICARALRYHAGRWYRRAVYAAVLAIVATLGVGLPDVNHDGRVILSALGAAARQAVIFITPAVAATSERKS